MTPCLEMLPPAQRAFWDRHAGSIPPGCTFHPRCPHANERCRTQAPETIEAEGMRLACHGVEEGRI